MKNKSNRSTINLVRGLLLLGGITACGVAASTLLSLMLHMTSADFQVCLLSVLFSGLSTIGVFLGFYFSHDRKAAHSNGLAIVAERRSSIILLAILLTMGITFSILAPTLGLMGSKMFGAIVEVLFSAALASSAWFAMSHFFPDGVIGR